MAQPTLQEYIDGPKGLAGAEMGSTLSKGKPNERWVVKVKPDGPGTQPASKLAETKLSEDGAKAKARAINTELFEQGTLHPVLIP